MDSAGLSSVPTVRVILAVFAVLALTLAFAMDWSRSDPLSLKVWQQAVVPGALSRSHASLTNNCAACHTPVRGVEAKLCIACHADNVALLQRQPTVFHAQIQVCSGCHLEHQAGARMPTTMDHAVLADAAHRELRASATAGLTGESLPANQPRRGDESMLNCASCHATKDRHQGFFGADCAQCHASSQWTIAEFRHPSPASTECAQCHKPPPSHHMMHFSMMSARIARQPNAQVNQCFLCHQTTVWNDIKGVGWTKVH